MTLDALQLSLMALWGAFYGAGMWISRPDRDERRRFARWGKLGMIACFAGMALYGLLTRPPGSAAFTYAALILPALILGGVGDVLLAELTPLKQPLLPAILSFGAGHVLYALALTRLASTPLVGQIGFATVGLIWLVLLGAGIWQRLNPASCPNLRQLALTIYFVLLGGVLLMALLLWSQQPRAWPVGLGLLLFAISDLLLGFDLSGRGRFPLIGDLIWILYASGQMLIALSIWQVA